MPDTQTQARSAHSGRVGGVEALVRPRKPHLHLFRDDGETPNNPRCALIVYRSPVRLPDGADPADVFEALFAANGWKDSWRDGIYPYPHFHSAIHEALGVARGSAVVQFGGEMGRRIAVKAGDVVVLPAGVGHEGLEKSRDLLIVGAYPASGRYDEHRPGEIAHATALRNVAETPVPAADPVYGARGPLPALWSGV